MIEQSMFIQKALIELDVLTKSQVDAALSHAVAHEITFCEALVQSELISGRELALVRSDVCEVPFVDLDSYEPCIANTAVLPRATAERHCAFPLFIIDDVLTIAMDDPLDLDATDAIRQIVRSDVDTVLATREQICAAIAKAYNLGVSQMDPHTHAASGTVETDVSDQETSAPVVAAVNQILADSIRERASDIHLNPDEHELRLRYRVDGILQNAQGPPLSMHPGIVQRLKVMAHLDLTQVRRPQDGKFRFRHNGVSTEVRMSTLPTVCGENVVLRLLTNAQMIGDFLELGVPVSVASGIEEVISQPHGMFLVTGPTGSGKTTTLYTALSRLNDPSRNVMTIEDPVEIRMPYVRQVQVMPEVGMTFASALRSILRQDPDVVLVGEIRDSETATIALQAALTGHLVLSTLHTNDAVGAVARLRDFGLPSFVINSAVLGVIAQRLVRRLCQHCITDDTLDPRRRQMFGLQENVDGFKRGRGCARCGQSGYRGRIGLYEYLAFNGFVRGMVEEGASTEAIQQAATEHGMRLLWQDGLEKARLAQTTMDEVAKVAAISRFANADPQASVAA